MRGWVLTLCLLANPAFAADRPADIKVRPLTAGTPSPFEAVMALGEADRALATGDADRAARGYASVLAHDPGLAAARLGLADARLALGDARGALETARTLGPEATLLRRLAQTELGTLGDPVGALAPHLSDARAVTALGRWLDRAGRGGEARRLWVRHHASLPPGAAHNNIGLSFLREAKPARARAAFAHAVRADPARALYRNNARIARLAGGDLVGALTGLDPRDAPPLLARAGRDALARGDAKLARLLLERANSLSPRHDPAWVALAEQAGQAAALADQARREARGPSEYGDRGE